MFQNLLYSFSHKLKKRKGNFTTPSRIVTQKQRIDVIHCIRILSVKRYFHVSLRVATRITIRIFPDLLSKISLYQKIFSINHFASTDNDTFYSHLSFFFPFYVSREWKWSTPRFFFVLFSPWWNNGYPFHRTRNKRLRRAPLSNRGFASSDLIDLTTRLILSRQRRARKIPILSKDWKLFFFPQTFQSFNDRIILTAENGYRRE